MEDLPNYLTISDPPSEQEEGRREEGSFRKTASAYAGQATGKMFQASQPQLSLSLLLSVSLSWSLNWRMFSHEPPPCL
ncbi:hypothetical protein LEMLEM_LOCUS8888, partial [Lemmus lemmus]